MKGALFMTALKKPLSGILAIIFIFVFTVATPLTVFAADEETTFASAEEIELNKKSDGDFEYIKIKDNTEIAIVGYTGSDAIITVPSSVNSTDVTTIGPNCFKDNTTVTEIKLNSAVVTLEEGAFMGCTALKKVTGMDSLTKICASAFEGCSSLTEFKVPDSVIAVPERCFAGCTALATVKEHKNLKNVAKDAFTGTAWEEAAPDGALNLGRVLYSYKGDITNLVIGKDIEIIESYVFLGCTDIKSVTFGEDVEEIGLYAFQNCTGIETAVFGGAVSVVDDGAFKGCSSLKSVDFSKTTIATVGYESFSGCSSLSEAKFSETLCEIGDCAFEGTKVASVDLGKDVESVGPKSFKGDTVLESITVSDKNKEYSSADGVLYSANGKAIVLYPAAKTGSFEIPAKVEEIRNGAFRNSLVTSIVFPEDTALNTIGAYAFENAALESIVIPESVTTINNSAFKLAKKLGSVTLGNKVTYIGASAFENCVALSEIKLPDTLKDIAAYAFKNSGLKSVNIGDGVVRIDTAAFLGNASLTDLYLGSRLEKLGDNAFAGCSSLVTVTLPDSLKTFNAAVFKGCSSLKNLAVSEKNENYKAVGGAIYSADGKTFVISTSSAAKTIVKGTEIIASDAFILTPEFSSIAFPSTLKTVNNSALDVTSWYKSQSGGAVYAGNMLYKVVGNVATLTISSGITAISEGAVTNPTVKAVSFPSSLKYIGTKAFSGSSIVTAVIPSAVTVIDDAAFEGVSTLKAVTLSAGLEELGSAAFKGCSSLEKISFPNGLKAIPTDAFANCTKLSSASLGVVETISKYAFSGCAALKSIELPATITEIDPISFLGCKSLERVDVAAGNVKYKSVDGVVISVNDNEENPEFNTIALYPAGKEGAYAVPEDIKNIADRAFYDCDGLTEITFANIENIGAEAFFDCDAVRTVNIPESGKKIGSNAFAACDELREFIVNSNLTDYEDNTFDGCNYFNYDMVTINVPDNSGLLLVVIVAVFVVIGVVWYLVYKKKQKKLEKEILAKNAEKETINN